VFSVLVFSIRKKTDATGVEVHLRLFPCSEKAAPAQKDLQKMKAQKIRYTVEAIGRKLQLNPSLS
jgi:hypothetical protein